MEQPNQRTDKPLTRGNIARDIQTGRVRILNGRAPVRIGRRPRATRGRRTTLKATRRRVPRPRRTNGGGRTLRAHKTSIAAPAMKHSGAVQTAERSLDAWSKLSPLAQHEMTILRPGEFNTPFVEANGVASKLTTAVMNGLWTQTFTPANLGTTKYVVITVCPLAALTASIGNISSGVGIVYAEGANTLAMSTLRGAGFTEVYGTTAFASKILPYATRIEATIQCPIGNLSGTIWTGCLPVRSFSGGTVDSLIQSSTATYDGKSLLTTQKVVVKAAINDRSLVHFVNNRTVSDVSQPMDSPGEISDEWVSYIILSKNFALDYAGNVLGLTINVTAHSNTIWWPAINSPALNGVVSKSNQTTAALTHSQDHFSKVAETYQSDPRPWGIKDLLGTVDTVMKYGDTIPVLQPYTSAARSILGAVRGVLSDPLSQVEDYSSLIADLAWFNAIVDAKWLGYSDPDIHQAVDDWIEASDALSALAKSKQEHCQAFKQSCLEGKQVCHHGRGGTHITYLDSDGRLLDYEDHMKAYKSPLIEVLEQQVDSFADKMASSKSPKPTEQSLSLRKR